MPTMSRLLAAVFYAAIFGYASFLALETYSDARPPVFFLEINIAIASAIGWHLIGKAPGDRFAVGFANGITGTVVISLLILAAHGTVSMFKFTRDLRYDGIMESLVAIIAEGIKLATQIQSPQLTLVVFGGGALAGILLQILYKRLGE